MKTIFLYNKNDLGEIIQIPANSLKDFENDKKAHFPLFKEGVHFYFDEQLKNPIYKDDVVREMNDVELIENGLLELQEGEVIEDNKIIKKERPNQYSKWNKETSEWEESLVDKLQYLKNSRQTKQQEFVAYKKELTALEEEKTEFEGEGFDISETEERIVEITAEMDLLKIEIAKLTKEINKIKI